MENLPAELLAKIFDHLSDSDILNLPSHIISFTLTDAQAQKLLQTMRVSLNKSSLIRLNRISRHPNLARHVQGLRFYNASIGYISPKEYVESYWSTYHDYHHPRLPENLAFANYSKLAVKQPPGNCSVAACFARYRMQLEGQKRMEKQEDDVRLLNIAFRLLPKLETISIDNMDDAGLRDVLGDAWCYGVEQDSLEHCGSHLLKVLLQVMSTSAKNISSFKILYDARSSWIDGGCNIMNFPALITKLPLNAIPSAVQSLQSLVLKSVCYDIEEIQFHDAAREKSSGYYWSRKVDKDAEYGTTKAIAKMLSSAPSLEELTLKFYDDYREHRQLLLKPYIPLHSMRGSNELQNLKRLSLANFKTRQDQLVRFLLKVAGTVTRIHIDEIVLDHGSWTSTFLRLRGMFTRLERFKIGSGYLMDAGLGIHELGPEEFGCSVKARHVSVCIADYHPNPGTLLRWFRDGTGSIPITPTRHKRF